MTAKECPTCGSGAWLAPPVGIMEYAQRHLDAGTFRVCPHVAEEHAKRGRDTVRWLLSHTRYQLRTKPPRLFCIDCGDARDERDD